MAGGERRVLDTVWPAPSLVHQEPKGKMPPPNGLTVTEPWEAQVLGLAEPPTAPPPT